MKTTKSSNRPGSPSSTSTPVFDRGSWIILQCRLDHVDHSELDNWMDHRLDDLEIAMSPFQTRTSLKKSLRRETRSTEDLIE